MCAARRIATCRRWRGCAVPDGARCRTEFGSIGFVARRGPVPMLKFCFQMQPGSRALRRRHLRDRRRRASRKGPRKRRRKTQFPTLASVELRLARDGRRLARPAGRRGARPDQAGSRSSLSQQCRRAGAGDDQARRLQGFRAQALGRRANARLQRGGAQRQAVGSVRGPGALLARRRSRATALSGRAVLFHPDAQAGVDDLAARPHGPPHLSSPTSIPNP